MKTLLTALFLMLPAAARADVPPPEDYVEACTVEKQTVSGLECQSCQAWHGERDACDKTLGKDGYRKMCKTWGASAWGEVWCKGEAKPAEPVKPADPAQSAEAEAPAPTKKSSCTGGGAELLSALALVTLVLRRRR